MFNHKNIRIIALVCVALFIAPSVYAKMQAIAENDLALISAQAGINMTSDQYIQARADSISLYQDTSNQNGITLNRFYFGNGDGNYANYVTDPRPARMSSDMKVDFGTSTGGQTWIGLIGGGFGDNKIGFNAVNDTDYSGLQVTAAGTKYSLGNLSVSGMFMGTDLALTTSGYTGSSAYSRGTTNPQSTFISANGNGGINFYQTNSSMYAGTIQLAVNSANNKFIVSNIYNYAPADLANDPSTWTAPNGVSSMGSAAKPCSINVGTDGAGKTYLQIIIQEMTGNIQVKSVKFADPADDITYTIQTGFWPWQTTTYVVPCDFGQGSSTTAGAPNGVAVATGNSHVFKLKITLNLGANI